MEKPYSNSYSVLFFMLLFIFSFLIPSSTGAALIKTTFSVDITKCVHSGIFNTASDKVYLRGSFNSWDTSLEMTRTGSSFVYSVLVELDQFSYSEYKYFISSAGAPNNGFEDSVGAAHGNRYHNTSGFGSILAVDFYNNQEPSSEHINITSPAAGSAWLAGSAQNISWNASGITNVKIEYTTNAGQTWHTLAGSVPAADGNYNWTLPDVVSYEWRIRISDAADPTDIEYSQGLLVTYSDLASSVPPLLKIEYPVFYYPLNAYYPPTTTNDDQIINGFVGNACGPTVVANILRYWEFPRKGKGARSFTDALSCQWSADFEGTVYEYDRMFKDIVFDSPDSVYKAAAVLMYHSGVAMHNYWRNGAKEGIIDAMHEYFHFSKKSKFLERTYYTPAQWEKVVKSELSAGRPLLSAGPGHWFIVDGYTSNDLYHVRWDYGEAANEYLPLYGFKPYEGNHWIFAYLEPELDGRYLHLSSPNGGENLKKNSICEIKWESVGVSNIQLEYSTNNGYDWIMFADNIPAAAGEYFWTVDAGNNDNYKVRISAAEDINIYDRSDNVFSIYDVKELSILSSLNNYFQAGTVIPIRWQSKGIPKVVIQYSADGGSSWNNIGEFLGPLGILKWNVPDLTSENCQVRIYDKSDSSNVCLSNNFSIGKSEILGGPYAKDANTVALLHFDGDLTNDANNTYNGAAFNKITFSENKNSGLDYYVKIDNSGTTGSAVSIPNYSALSLSGDWTIELWFKINSWGSGITAYPFMFWKPGANYIISLDAASKTLSAGYDYTGGAESVKLPQNSLQTGRWYYLAFIRNTSTSTLKCLLHDSTRQIISAASAAYNPAHLPKLNTEPVLIGGSSVGGNVQFDGFVDEVRISNNARKISAVNLITRLGGRN